MDRVYQLVAFASSDDQWLNRTAQTALVALWLLLLGGSFLVYGVLLPLGRAGPELRGRTFTWIILVSLFTAAVQRPSGITALMCLGSLLGIREFLALCSRIRRPNWLADALMYVVCVLQYVTIYFDLYGMFLVLIPVHVFLFIPYFLTVTQTYAKPADVRAYREQALRQRQIEHEQERRQEELAQAQAQASPVRKSARRSKSPARFRPSSSSSSVDTAETTPSVAPTKPGGFISTLGMYHLCLMSTTFSLAHVAQLINFRSSDAIAGGNVGLVLFIMAVTELNDVAQFCAGKLFGRTPAAPSISPKKTVEGVLGGVLACVALSLLLRPLTPMHSPWEAAAFGVVVALSGFVGDLTMSCVKRDMGFKDTGSILPGHGGLLDRVDSLAYTAPVFYHWINHFHNRSTRDGRHHYSLIWSTPARPLGASALASVDQAVRQALVLVVAGALGAVLLAALLGRLSSHVDLRVVANRLYQRGWTVFRGVILFVGLHWGLSLTGQINAYAFFAFSLLKEYLSSIPTRPADRSLLLAIFLTVPLQALWLHMRWYGLAIIFVPLQVFLYVPLHLILIGQTRGFVRAASSIHWGVMMSVFTVSHCVLLMSYSDAEQQYDGPSMLLFTSIVVGLCSLVLGAMAPRHAGTRWAFVAVSATGACVAWAVSALTPFGRLECLVVGACLGHSAFAGEKVLQCLTAAIGRTEDDASFDLRSPMQNLFARQGPLLYSIPVAFHYYYWMNASRRALIFG